MTAEFTLDRPIAVTCPDCGGALRQSQLGTLTQFRCHIGHVYTSQAILVGQFRALEQLIEATLRSFNERAELCREMVELAGVSAGPGAEWRLAMEEAHAQANRMREMLEYEWIHPGLVNVPLRSD